MEIRNIEKAKSILQAWEARIRHYKSCKQDRTNRAAETGVRVEDAFDSWTPKMQHNLDVLRNQQRYFTLIYAFLRKRPYAKVEQKTKKHLNRARLNEAYAVMTGQLIPKEDDAELFVWLHYVDPKREKPVQVANPLPENGLFRINKP